MHQQHLQFSAQAKEFFITQNLLIEQMLREKLGKRIGQNPAPSLAQEGLL
jgi:hypothetical protein